MWIVMKILVYSLLVIVAVGIVSFEARAEAYGWVEYSKALEAKALKTESGAVACQVYDKMLYRDGEVKGKTCEYKTWGESGKSDTFKIFIPNPNAAKGDVYLGYGYKRYVLTVSFNGIPELDYNLIKDQEVFLDTGRKKIKRGSVMKMGNTTSVAFNLTTPPTNKETMLVDGRKIPLVEVGAGKKYNGGLKTKIVNMHQIILNRAIDPANDNVETFDANGKRVR